MIVNVLDVASNSAINFHGPFSCNASKIKIPGQHQEVMK